MPVPVWVFPAAKAVGKWVIATGGPPLIEVVKKYGPSVFRGYRKHGFKAKQIIDHVIAENAAERAKPVIAKSGKRRARQQQG